MRLTPTALAVAGLTLAGTALAQEPEAILDNQCSETLYWTSTDSTQQSTTTPINGGTSTSIQMSGMGVSFGFTTNDQYYSNTTPKLIWGFSVVTDQSLIYYTVSDVDGDPFAGQSWNLTINPSNACPPGQPSYVDSYSSNTYTCADDVAYTLTFCS